MTPSELHDGLTLTDTATTLFHSSEYDLSYGPTYTRIDVWGSDGRWANTIYVHHSEYRHQDA